MRSPRTSSFPGSGPRTPASATSSSWSRAAPQAELKRLILTINPQTYVVENLEFNNSLGEETSFAFSRTTLGVKQPPAFFTFSPPPGVQVVRENQGAR